MCRLWCKYRSAARARHNLFLFVCVTATPCTAIRTLCKATTTTRYSPPVRLRSRCSKSGLLAYNDNGGLAIDSGQQDQELPTTSEPSTPFRTLETNFQRRCKRAFARDENVEVPDIPEAGHSVVHTCMIELWRRLIHIRIAELDNETAMPFSSSRSDGPSVLQESYQGSGDSVLPYNYKETEPERDGHWPALLEIVIKVLQGSGIRTPVSS